MKKKKPFIGTVNIICILVLALLFLQITKKQSTKKENDSETEVLASDFDNTSLSLSSSIQNHENLYLKLEKVTNENKPTYYVIRLYENDILLDEYSLLDYSSNIKSPIFDTKYTNLDYDNNTYPEFWIYDSSLVFKDHYLFTITNDLKISFVKSFNGANLTLLNNENSFLITRNSSLYEDNIEQIYKYIYDTNKNSWSCMNYQNNLSLDFDGGDNDSISVINSWENSDGTSTNRPLELQVTLNDKTTLTKEFGSNYYSIIYTSDFCNQGKEQIALILRDKTSNYCDSELHILEVSNNELIETLTITDDSISSGLENNSDFFTSLYSNIPKDDISSYSYLTNIDFSDKDIRLILGSVGKNFYSTNIHWNGTEWGLDESYFRYTEQYQYSDDSKSDDSYTVSITTYK